MRHREVSFAFQSLHVAGNIELDVVRKRRLDAWADFDETYVDGTGIASSCAV